MSEAEETKIAEQFTELLEKVLDIFSPLEKASRGDEEKYLQGLRAALLVTGAAFSFFSKQSVEAMGLRETVGLMSHAGRLGDALFQECGPGREDEELH